MLRKFLTFAGELLAALSLPFLLFALLWGGELLGLS